LLAKVPKYHELIYPTLKALKALGGSGTNEEILDKVCELEQFPAEIEQVPHSDNRAQVRKMVAADRKSKSLDKTSAEDGDTDVTSGNGVNWRDTLLSVLFKIKPDAFERLAQRILREAGFTKVQVTGESGDGGIDGIGIFRVNLVSFTVLFQCKRYNAGVGASDIRDFRGAMMGRCDKGIFITTGTFSSDARKEATRDGALAIDLIDGEALCDLLKSLKLGVTITLVEEVSVQTDLVFTTLTHHPTARESTKALLPVPSGGTTRAKQASQEFLFLYVPTTVFPILLSVLGCTGLRRQLQNVERGAFQIT
jgi:restriction system protein